VTLTQVLFNANQNKYMSLRPTSLTAQQYVLATKPALGYEQQLYVSTELACTPGSLLVAGVNSGVYTPSVADNAILNGEPQELMCVLTTQLEDSANVVLTVTGTDEDNNALTGTATFAPPAYAQDQSVTFPKSWAVEVIPGTEGALWKTITNVSIVCTGLAQNAAFNIVGVPSISSYKLIATKVSLNYDPKAPLPTAVQNGRDLGAFIKAGNIDIGNLEINGKVPTSADGLQRYNGVRVTGLIKEVKENQVGTMNIFLVGLIMTAKAKVGEDQTPNTLDATAMYEQIGFILAGGVGQP
jgi:hypothetical protein